MANIDVKEGGICVWMASVRESMVNDPCHQIFENQVMSHGFTFLDDYLESILAGPQQGPIIELVKTPARKRNVPRKARAGTAAATAVENTPSLSLDSTNSSKEVPINSFHKALLQAKERSAQNALNPQKPSVHRPSVSSGSQEKTHSRSVSVQLIDFRGVAMESRSEAIPPQQYQRDPPSNSSIPCQASERGTELSVIAEGDESPERGTANMLRLSTVDSNQGESPHAVPPFFRAAEESTIDGNPKAVEADHQSHMELSPDTRCSVDVYHSISLNSPQEPQSSEAGIHTEPIPSRTEITSPRNHERNASTAPLPVVPTSNLARIPDTIYVPLNDLSPGSLARKNGIAGFPTLPAPSPLRKSLRLTQDALASSALPTTAPAPVPLGKRTSWLMKAREAKAMEGTNSLPGISAAAAPIPASFPRASTAVKRKSGDMIGELPPGLDKDQRKSKVARSAEVGNVPHIPKETKNTEQRDFTFVQGGSVTYPSVDAAVSLDHSESHRMDVDQGIIRLDSADEGFIDLFKRTVEGLGARAGKSMGKSLGGAAAVALAEARAAAEAKVAKRNKVSDSSEPHDDGRLNQEPLKTGGQSDEQALFVPLPQTAGAECRFSISDLAPETIRRKEPGAIRTVQGMSTNPGTDNGDQVISTTPPASPPFNVFVKPMGPVFNRPPLQPVFMPPASKQPTTISTQPKEFPFNLPPGKFTLPAAVSLGIPARLTPTANDSPIVQQTSRGSGQSSQSNAFSEQDGVLIPSMQDPLCIESRPSEERSADGVVIDDDDSWPLEEKFAAVEPGWRPFDFSNVDKEDTWSSLPTESQGATRNLTAEKNNDTVPLPMDGDTKAGRNNGGLELEQQIVETSDFESSTMETSEAEEVAEAGTGNRSRAESTARVGSQTSLASTASSSQSQVGFFSQATKLVNSMLGGGKKVKPELKSLQLAAAAAKKQHEETDKKTQRLKDMEARRQVVMAKKAEEERIRLLEEEKKSREEVEKRKREREENTDRRPLKPPVSTKKTEDDASKKRKLAPETEKKPESKKLPSKDKKDLAPPTKSSATPTTKLVAQKGAKAAATALVSSAAYNSTQNAAAVSSAKLVVPDAKPFKVASSALKGKAKAKPQEDHMGDKPPSTMIQSQMAARAKAQMQAAKLPTPEVPSESIELPDINSEYSDSEDEDRVRTFDPPDWAQSPELHMALQMQSTVNPDDIFGAIQPLRMDEIFRTRQSRFRARTSSANWSGTDGLTVGEIREYERRMGFRQTHAS